MISVEHGGIACVAARRWSNDCVVQIIKTNDRTECEGIQRKTERELTNSHADAFL